MSRNPKDLVWAGCQAKGGPLQPRGGVGKRADGPWHTSTTNKRGHQYVKTRMRRSQKRALRRAVDRQNEHDE